jgi:hypothetical protein
MTRASSDRLHVDLLGVSKAANACRSAGSDALTELTKLLAGLTKEAIEAAAGHDDYGKQITDGWNKSGAERFPEFARGIGAQLVARGNQMTACRKYVERSDADAAHQLRAKDIGLALKAEGWSPIESPPGKG